MEKLKLLMGGSPCTHWSIAQTKNRETEPSGLGWELFLNYRIARDKYKPDYFLYENNKSMAPAIRAQITRELGVEPVLINSDLLSAQSRWRLYWVGKRNRDGTYSRVDVEQPEDRGILLRDILENGVEIGASGEKAYALKAQYYKSAPANFLNGGGHFPQTGVAEPIRIGTIESTAKNADFDSQQYRVYSPDGKSVTLCGQGGGVGAKTGLYAVPAPIEYNPLHSCDVVITDQNIRCTYKDGSGTAQGYSVYFDDVKSPSVIAGHAHKMKVIVPATGKEYPVYRVQDGLITIKGQRYPVKLLDGYYIIRKLTVTECERLQTVPEGYTRWGAIQWAEDIAKKYKNAIEKGKARLNMTTRQLLVRMSDTQAYKMLGNGWTVDVIAHILSYIPRITEAPVEVLSMYDGMSCGHIALDKLGANVVRYYATEIDKYAIQTTQANYPDTVQLGDAFQVRDDGWSI